MNNIFLKFFLLFNALAAIYLSCFTLRKEYFASNGKVAGTVFIAVISLVVLIIAANIICGKEVGEFAISGLLGFVMSILFACASDKEGKKD